MSQHSNDKDRNDLGKKQSSEELTDLTDAGGNKNASENRSGTTDMGNTAQRGSGITTKNTVAGSDFDGQVSGE